MNTPEFISDQHMPLTVSLFKTGETERENNRQQTRKNVENKYKK